MPAKSSEGDKPRAAGVSGDASVSRSDDRGKATGASEGDAPAPPRKPSKPRRVRLSVGGHTILADPVAPTPEPIQTCSVCGQDPDECPHGDGGSWAVEEG